MIDLHISWRFWVIKVGLFDIFIFFKNIYILFKKKINKKNSEL